MTTALKMTLGPSRAWKKGWVLPRGNDGVKNRYSTTVRVGQNAQTTTSFSTGSHSLSEPAIAAELERREQEIESSFARLKNLLQELAPQQFDDNFAQKAVTALSMIGIEAKENWFVASWTNPLDMGAIYARCVSHLFASMLETGSEH